MYRLIKQEGRAKRGEFTTVHGVIQTPVFMNVGTVAAIKGAVSTADLEQIGTQVELSNTYHLHVRPGDQIIKQMGGLYVLEQTDPDGFRWISGIFSGGAAQNQGRGRNFPLSYRRTQDFHGSGGEHADPVQSGIYHCHGF